MNLTEDEQGLLSRLQDSSITPHDARRQFGRDMQEAYDSLARKGLAVISFSRWRITVKGKQLLEGEQNG